MNFGPIILLALVAQSPSPEWEQAKKEVDLLLKEKRGVGLIVTIEHKRKGKLTVTNVERGGSTSAWKLEYLPLDPSTGNPGKGDEIERAGGFTIQLMKPIESEVTIPENTQKVLLRFRTAKYKGLGRVVELPDLGGPRKIIVLHLPEL